MSEQVDINVAASEHHVHPISAYLGVYGALLVLTVTTVGVSYLNLGPASLYAALVVAFIKAALVLGFFMHLKYDSRFHQVIVFSSLIFILILFGFTFIDLSSRAKVLDEHGNFALAADRDAEEVLNELNRAAKATEAAGAAASQTATTQTATTQTATTQTATTQTATTQPATTQPASPRSTSQATASQPVPPAAPPARGASSNDAR